jgi:uncharacterized membrane protein YphA (DoxX/SURF4 family)
MYRNDELSHSILLIRLAVGGIFFSQGILKFIDPWMGVVRFTKIGFAHPFFTAHFVGTFEILSLASLFCSVSPRGRQSWLSRWRWKSPRAAE